MGKTELLAKQQTNMTVKVEHATLLLEKLLTKPPWIFHESDSWYYYWFCVIELIIIIQKQTN